ncbi:hypothetical protein EJ03DRAFT_48320 [Teratosphaeria nubilosa]|uniref:Uncharacterized protein n=1 Tax=Teratosphaeria nubilosa TaxID=161662 RepID=A0A6G1KTL1_9PEZI|nr:hypothetical protein EJ03DRAFT_48320 [Teratosphaeria nubilosa]
MFMQVKAPSIRVPVCQVCLGAVYAASVHDGRSLVLRFSCLNVVRLRHFEVRAGDRVGGQVEILLGLRLVAAETIALVHPFQSRLLDIEETCPDQTVITMQFPSSTEEVGPCGDYLLIRRQEHGMGLSWKLLFLAHSVACTYRNRQLFS